MNRCFAIGLSLIVIGCSSSETEQVVGNHAGNRIYNEWLKQTDTTIGCSMNHPLQQDSEYSSPAITYQKQQLLINGITLGMSSEEVEKQFAPLVNVSQAEGYFDKVYEQVAYQLTISIRQNQVQSISWVEDVATFIEN